MQQYHSVKFRKGIRLYFRWCLSPALLAFVLAPSLAGCGAGSHAGVTDVVVEQMKHNREQVLKLIAEMEKSGQADKALAWRPGPGRAPIGWQLMHIAAVDDARAVYFGAPKVQEKKYVDLYGGGKAPDAYPPLEVIKNYLERTHERLVRHVESFDMDRLAEKPPAPYWKTYREGLRFIMAHEPHHQGQAHLTFNLYKVNHGLAFDK